MPAALRVPGYRGRLQVLIDPEEAERQRLRP
jgi:hypothetical protein